MLDRPRAAEQSITVSLAVNGASVSVAANPLATLASTLRDRLGLTGTKIGCDAGDCGACTVLVDGEQACACLVATAQAEGASVETVEGHGPDGLTDRLREAFLEHGAAQCGICTPGMLMAAVDCLTHSPNADRKAIEDALGGVLCRCTGYQKIVEAVMDVADAARQPSPLVGEGVVSLRETTGEGSAIAADMNPSSVVRQSRTTPSPTRGEGSTARGTSVGARIPRLDGLAKVNGTDLFGADSAPANSLWMRVVRSPHASATFTLGDLYAVIETTPGLVAILTADDVPGENSFGIFAHLRDQPVFAPGKVRFRGEAVLALVGSREAVEGVSDSDLPIAWVPLYPLSGIDSAVAPGAPALHPHAAGNILTRGNLKCGDIEAGHARAAATVEDHFETSFVEHAYIEPEAGYAVHRDDCMEVAACTQTPYMDRAETARVLGVEENEVRIRPTACGGGFGGKLDVSVQPLLAVAAHATGRPVRIVYSRTESMVSTTKRHPARIWAKASANNEGRLVAFESEADFNTGAYASWGPTVATRVPIHASGPYRVANVWNRSRAVYTNDTPAGAFRGFGVPQAAIAHEALMDDLAEALKLDRWHIRRINALQAGDTTPSGQKLEASAGLPECLDALKPDWDEALKNVAAFNVVSKRKRRGVGVACMWYGCGNTSMPNPSTMRIALDREGRLTFFNGAVDIGQGSTTVLTQIAADALGLSPEKFMLVVGDTGLTADAGKSSASRQTFVSGNATRLAARDLRRKILALANAGEDAPLALDGARLIIGQAEGSRTIDLAALESDKSGVVLEGIGTWDPPTTALDENGQGIPYATYGFAAQMAEVEVHMRLGTVKVQRIVAAHDVGRAINPTLTEGQIHGGIAQGLGLALMEEFIPGRTENLHDYLIPTVGDMPEIKTYLIEDPDPSGPFGAKGVGEPALIATAPAILSAIRHATGVRMTRVPALPHRVWEAVHR